MTVRVNPRVTITRACLRSSLIAMLVCGVSWSRPNSCPAQAPGDGEFAELRADAEEYFRDRVGPFIKTYCIDCHQISTKLRPPPRVQISSHRVSQASVRRENLILVME